MNQLSRRTFLASGSLFALSACSVARDAPRKSEVVAGADKDGTTPEASFSLVEVTSDNIAKISKWPTKDPRPAHKWPQRGAGLSEQKLAVGDTLSVRIWSAEESSLFTRPGERFADIPNVVISQSGHVSLPYIDDVHVAGLGLQAAASKIEEGLLSIVPSAQVQLQTELGRKNSVDMVGGVRSPGTFPLEERNLTVLNLVSAAGGLAGNPANPQVTITRGGSVYRMPYEDILENPSLDAALRGGDRVVLRADERSFMALGATGGQKVISFTEEKLSALRAVSLMGGIADNRADPQGLLVLRRYPVKSGASGPSKPQVVFSFDLTKADRIFAADQFLMQDGDLVLATQSPATTVQRVFGLFGSFLSAGRAISNL